MVPESLRKIAAPESEMSIRGTITIVRHKYEISMRVVRHARRLAICSLETPITVLGTGDLCLAQLG